MPRIILCIIMIWTLYTGLRNVCWNGWAMISPATTDAIESDIEQEEENKLTSGQHNKKRRKPHWNIDQRTYIYVCLATRLLQSVRYMTHTAHLSLSQQYKIKFPGTRFNPRVSAKLTLTRETFPFIDSIVSGWTGLRHLHANRSVILLTFNSLSSEHKSPCQSPCIQFFSNKPYKAGINLPSGQNKVRPT